MATVLQELITKAMGKGRMTYRDIARATQINHVSIAQYHRGEVTPDGKNLAILADYFGCEFYELTEESRRDVAAGSLGARKADQQDNRVELTPEERMIFDELSDLSPTEQLEWLLEIRKRKAEKKREEA